jgi:cathepsin B
MSVQYPVSCNKVNSACNGGGISSTWTWYAQYGEMLDVDYPYTSGDTMVAGTCFSTTGKRKFYAASHEWLTSITDMMEEIYLNGPIQVGMDVYYDFFTYKSGVYSHVTGDLAGGHSYD